jgi:hypothetical protein
MGRQVDRCIRQQDRHPIAAFYTNPPQRTRQTSHLFAEARVCPALIAVDDADAVGENAERTLENQRRAQRVPADVGWRFFSHASSRTRNDQPLHR